MAKENGINLVLLNLDKELINYVNNQNTGTESKQGEVSEDRKAEQITEMAVFGRGLVDKIELAYHQEGAQNYSVGGEDIPLFNAGAFKQATISLYTCNAGTPTDQTESNLWTSLAGKLATQTQTNVAAYHR